MPEGDLDATAPVQPEASKIRYVLVGAAVGVGLALAGGALGLAAAEAAAGGAVGGTGTLMLAGSTAVAVDCLHGDTLVTMSERSKKKIQDVKVGDRILSYNKNKLVVKSVLEVKEGSSKTMRELLLQAPDASQFSIKATAGHPFWTTQKGWAVVSPDEARFDKSKPVKPLIVGDNLVLRGGKKAKLLKIGETMPTQRTYNLIIDGPGTFFVEGILSHSGLPSVKK